MRSRPVISVIIPVYNTAEYLAECLDSVLAQTFQDNEKICINDGSTDGSPQILEAYAQKDSRIRIINQPNLGVVAARNNAIAQALGTYIFPLDSDDIIKPHTLSSMLNAIEEQKGDIITCRVMLFGTQQGEMILPKPNKYNMVQQNCLVNAALFRRADFMQSGGYNKSCFNGLEDYDLWLNLIFNHGKKIHRVPEILFFYRIKKAEESRNMQNKSSHKDIKKSFFKKYPQMRYYKLISFFLKPIIKLKRKITKSKFIF